MSEMACAGSVFGSPVSVNLGDDASCVDFISMFFEVSQDGFCYESLELCDRTITHNDRLTKTLSLRINA